MVGSRVALFLLMAGVMVLASGQWDAYTLYDEVRVEPPSAGPACSGECQRGYDWAVANEVNEDRLCEGEGDFLRGCLELVREARMEQASYFDSSTE